MRTLANEMEKSGSSADASLGAKLKALGDQLSEAKGHMGELKGELKEHKEAAGEAGEGLARLREGFVQLAEIAGIGLGIEAFKEWISETTEAAEKIEQAAAKLGISTTEVQSLGAVAKSLT
jgi:chromosome segregation ATPase